MKQKKWSYNICVITVIYLHHSNYRDVAEKYIIYYIYISKKKQKKYNINLIIRDVLYIV